MLCSVAVVVVVVVVGVVIVTAVRAPLVSRRFFFQLLYVCVYVCDA
jgi:hypothetical protein